MASLAETFDENPRHIPWINENKDFEGGRQNMMGFSCMKHSLPPWHSKMLLYPTFRSITHKKVSKPPKEIPDNPVPAVFEIKAFILEEP